MQMESGLLQQPGHWEHALCGDEMGGRGVKHSWETEGPRSQRIFRKLPARDESLVTHEEPLSWWRNYLVRVFNGVPQLGRLSGHGQKWATRDEGRYEYNGVE